MSDEDFAIEYACSSRMHQSFSIPATDSHGPLRVTYAVAGLQTDYAPTIVCISGMFGGRWIALMQHHVATKVGVRLVCVDRPGFGGSTPVSLPLRIQVWLETVPALMVHLKVSHIIPISASSGTIFLLNTLQYLPHILPPKNPYAALLAPWVHPSDSHVPLLSLAASPLISSSFISSYWNKINGWMANTLLPTLGASSGLLESFSTASFSSASTSVSGLEEEQKIVDAYGMTSSKKKALFAILLKYMFAEDTTGANDEANLCLRKVANVSWGVADDYAAYVPKLGEKWEKCASASKWNSKLNIEAYFASSDMMIGSVGQKYFESCWNEVNCGTAIRFEGIEVPDSSHDSIGDPIKGALERVFRAAKRALEENA